MRVNDLIEDNEGDKAVVREVLDDDRIVVEWDCRPGHRVSTNSRNFTNLSEVVRELDRQPPPLTDDQIIAYALAHAVATLDMSPDDDARCMGLLLKYGYRVGVEVPEGDEYQRAVLHRFDPERVPDFPLPQ